MKFTYITIGVCFLLINGGKFTRCEDLCEDEDVTTETPATINYEDHPEVLDEIIMDFIKHIADNPIQNGTDEADIKAHAIKIDEEFQAKWEGKGDSLAVFQSFLQKKNNFVVLMLFCQVNAAKIAVNGRTTPEKDLESFKSFEIMFHTLQAAAKQKKAELEMSFTSDSEDTEETTEENSEKSPEAKISKRSTDEATTNTKTTKNSKKPLVSKETEPKISTENSQDQNKALPVQIPEGNGTNWEEVKRRYVLPYPIVKHYSK